MHREKKGGCGGQRELRHMERMDELYMGNFIYYYNLIFDMDG